MTRINSIITSKHKDEIDELFNRDYRPCDVLKHFESKGIHLSKGSLYRYYKSYFSYRKKMNSEVFDMLYASGNINLAKALEKSLKLFRKSKHCMCLMRDVKAEDLRRKGNLYFHIKCGNYVSYVIAVHILNEANKIKPKSGHSKLSVSARSF